MQGESSRTGVEPDEHVGRAIARVRYETRMRMLHVRRIERPARWMVRLVLGGDLDGFESKGFDDHIKIFLPQSGAGIPSLPIMGPNGPTLPAGAERPVMRDYTPRRYDPAAGELTIEFALHDAGPATAWASKAKPGDAIGIGGPRGSMLIPMAFRHHILIGDETALPAISRRIEELPATAQVHVLVEIDGSDDELRLDIGTNVAFRWVHRHGRQEALLAAVQAVGLPNDDAYAWIACESGAAKLLRRHLVEDAGLPTPHVKAAGYWRRGEQGVHEVLGDPGPT